MWKKTNVLPVVIILAFIALACDALSPQTAPSPAPTQIIEPVFTQSPDELPRTEAEVPRVAVEEAKAALDSGAAVILDVRDAGAYELSHIPGAILIPLGEIQTNPTGLDLDKDQWIITYCT